MRISHADNRNPKLSAPSWDKFENCGVTPNFFCPWRFVSMPSEPVSAAKETAEVKTKTEEPQKEKKWSSFAVRAVWTVLLVALFVFVVLSGHVWIAGLCLSVQILAYREVINITGDPKYFENVPWGRTISWYFLVVMLYYLNGHAIVHFFQNVGILEGVLNPMLNYHRFLSYILYMGGFVFFVTTLRHGYYRQQFGQLSAAHMALIYIVLQGQFVLESVLHGIFWMIVPVAMVIVNDIAAYLCGITMGRTPLIKISPKKTVEGFVGAWICTGLFALVITHYASKSYYLICPMERVGVNYKEFDICVPNAVFLPAQWHVPSLLQSFVGFETFEMAPIYIHSIVLATFASLIAPFGGFFASGFKRAFKVKDFGSTIPGHGGVTDRFDCQFVMGTFSYMYYNTIINRVTPPEIATVLTTLSSLNAQQRQEIVKALSQW